MKNKVFKSRKTLLESTNTHPDKPRFPGELKAALRAPCLVAFGFWKLLGLKMLLLLLKMLLLFATPPNGFLTWVFGN